MLALKDFLIVYIFILFLFQISTNVQILMEAVPTRVTTLLVDSLVPVQPGSHWMLANEAVKVKLDICTSKLE